MNTQHTPGPWQVSPYCIQHIGNNRYDPAIAGVFAHVVEGSKEANARLIAAAPDLLEALKNLLESHYNGNIINADCLEAEAAIAKATGEANG